MRTHLVLFLVPRAAVWAVGEINRKLLWPFPRGLIPRLVEEEGNTLLCVEFKPWAALSNRHRFSFHHQRKSKGKGKKKKKKTGSRGEKGRTAVTFLMRKAPKLKNHANHPPFFPTQVWFCCFVEEGRTKEEEASKHKQQKQLSGGLHRLVPAIKEQCRLRWGAMKRARREWIPPPSP